MSIQAKVTELNSVNTELKSLRERTKVLRAQAKRIENEIDEYLVSKDQPGLKYKGTAIIRQVETKHKNKKKSEQKQDSIQILERLGIQNPEKVLEDLSNAKKGSPVEKKKLKFKKYKNEA